MSRAHSCMGNPRPLPRLALRRFTLPFPPFSSIVSSMVLMPLHMSLPPNLLVVILPPSREHTASVLPSGTVTSNSDERRSKWRSRLRQRPAARDMDGRGDGSEGVSEARPSFGMEMLRPARPNEGLTGTIEGGISSIAVVVPAATRPRTAPTSSKLRMQEWRKPQLGHVHSAARDCSATWGERIAPHRRAHYFHTSICTASCLGRSLEEAAMQR